MNSTDMSRTINTWSRRLLTLLIMAMPAIAHAQDEAVAPTGTGLTSEFLYKYLVGEIAGQRGELGLAGTLFLDLATSSRNPQIAARAARAAAYGNQMAVAIRAATLWTELDPASSEAHQMAAQLLLGANRPNEAKIHLAALLTPDNTRGSNFLYLNTALARYPDKNTALRLGQELAQPYPDSPDAHFTVAHLALAAGQTGLALESLKTAETLRPGWTPAALLHSDILARNSADQALAFLHYFLSSYPEAHDVRLAYARLLVNQKRLEAARAQFERLVNDVPDNADIPVVVALLVGQAGDYAQADDYFRLALTRGFGDRDRVHFYLGQSAEQQGHDEAALDWYDQIEAGEHLFNAGLRRAGIIARRGELAEARAALHTLPDLNNEQQATVALFEASLLTQAGEHQLAYTVLERAISDLPATPEMLYDHAMAAERIQRYDIMEQQLRRLIALRPNDAQAYNALGYTLANRNERLNEAAHLLEKALTLKPDDHAILDSMGWLKYRMGRLDMALDYLRRAYALNTDPEIAAHLGEVLWQQGHHAEARQTWEKALREHPNSEPLLNTLQKFQQ